MKSVLKGIWAFCSFVFVPQWGRTKSETRDKKESDMNKSGIVTKDLSHVDIPRLKQYGSTNQNTTDVAAADDAVDEFLNNYRVWKDVVGYMVAGEDGEQLYGAALSTFSGNLYLSNHLAEETIQFLRDEITDYEGRVDYNYTYLDALYSNLVVCLHKLSLASNDELKGLLKKAIYYSQAEANHTSYQLECFAYRSASDYMIEAFKNEELSMSAPTTFNDPFDCPILELMNQYGDDISKLIREAYQECLKITCFVKNTKLEPRFDEKGNRVLEPKHDNDPEEYLNELMWAHYAKNHTGICIKYHFHNDLTKFADKAKSQIAYFRDVEYTTDMDVYRKNGAINLRDAFFAKSKAWEYENELRLLVYAPNGSGDYASIEAKDSVAAVYFGLKCQGDKRDEIIRILKGHKWVNEIRKWDDTQEMIVDIKESHPVEFFQMEIDEKHFGKLKAVKICV